MAKASIRWRESPSEHDYPAAKSYLNLLFDRETAASFVLKLRVAPRSMFRAKDIFRASELPLISSGDFYVERVIKKVSRGKSVSPMLLVRQQNTRVIIADGYHRLCAVYLFDEEAMIPCHIV